MMIPSQKQTLHIASHTLWTHFGVCDEHNEWHDYLGKPLVMTSPNLCLNQKQTQILNTSVPFSLQKPLDMLF